ncbi:group 1 truncated hemoglobin [Bacillus sp. 165]|uniref:group I truncated hemoglobin n=1 Tax=Bacillus sp. 165 TaxID=1529117 RepID=UPI001ADBE799|nr:group 1 truncated hemoglobin [Bacillus sp. 165]MBO9130389.1 group 1 truncated hemoglobin [Bacillus sp. 165]
MGTLYDKLGGKEAVSQVVDSFYKKVLADDRINHFFANTDMEAQRRHQTAFISYALGGPQYTGRSMEKAHEGLNLQEEQWDAVVENLVTSLQEANVGDEDINTIAEQLLPLKPHILGK